MEWTTALLLIFLLLAVVVAAKLKKSIRVSTPAAEELPYVMKDSLLTPAERSFYGVLTLAVESRYEIHSKVRVADVLEPSQSGDRSSWQKAFNKISAKHFDFVLCNPDSLSVEAVVELNDSSHKRSKRAQRDEFLKSICKSAGLHLLFFGAKSSYSVTDLRDALNSIDVA